MGCDGNGMRWRRRISRAKREGLSARSVRDDGVARVMY